MKPEDVIHPLFSNPTINKELINKLQVDDAVKMRRSLANALSENIVNDVDATATDASDYDYVIEDAIADWKSSNEEWQQVCLVMQKS